MRRPDTGARAIMALLEHPDPLVRETARGGLASALQGLLLRHEGNATRVATQELGLASAQPLMPLIHRLDLEQNVDGRHLPHAL